MSPAWRSTSCHSSPNSSEGRRPVAAAKTTIGPYTDQASRRPLRSAATTRTVASPRPPGRVADAAPGRVGVEQAPVDRAPSQPTRRRRSPCPTAASGDRSSFRRPTGSETLRSGVRGLPVARGRAAGALGPGGHTTGARRAQAERHRDTPASESSISVMATSPAKRPICSLGKRMVDSGGKACRRAARRCSPGGTCLGAA